MVRTRTVALCLSIVAASLVGSTVVAAKKGVSKATSSFYKRGPLFAFRPDERRNGVIGRFGPVGIGVDLAQPAFVMKVRNVEAGSPAATAGLKKGQIIESINGEKLIGIDPRIQLGDMITKAEAKDGVMLFVVRDKAGAPTKKVKVQIAALGKYEKTWPLKCKKSERIVRGLADNLRGKDLSQISHGHAPAMLFMLSTGEDKDLDVVRGWVSKMVDRHKNDKEITVQNWALGYTGQALCEYYLRTGDKSVMSVINKLSDCARWGMYNNGWAHGTYQGQRDRSKARMAFPYMGGGHINACGVGVTTFLLMAKECGAKVDEFTLQSSLRQFFRFAGRGNVAYGDGIPEQSFVDNGKTGALAFTMAAAANLTPNGEESVYADARDNSAVKGFYSTSWMLIGHTGGGVGEIWRSYSMGLMYRKKNKKYREFMDSRRWFYELSRRFDGSFGIAGGGRYDNESWGALMGMSYTAPRRTLRLTGAKRTKYSKQYKLPKRPWGNKNDDVFCSLKPAMQEGVPVPDLDKETFLGDSSRAAFGKMGATDVTDRLLLHYAHHPDQGIRRGAASYISRHERDHLIPRLLKAKDPRARHAGTMVIYCRFKRRPITPDRVTDEMAALLAKIINDPKESWWCQENAMKAFALAKPELIAPHVDRLLYFVGHKEWWLSAAAIAPLTRVAGDPRFYQKVLSAVGKVAQTNTHLVWGGPAKGLFGSMNSASPAVRKTAIQELCRVYAAFPTAAQIHPPNRISMIRAEDKCVSDLAGWTAQLPGGLDALFPVSKKRYPDQTLPHGKLYLKLKPSQMSPELKKAVDAFKVESAKKK